MSSTEPAEDRDALIKKAARWHAKRGRREANPVVLIRQEFGLSPLEACLALAAARKLPLERGDLFR